MEDGEGSRRRDLVDRAEAGPAVAKGTSRPVEISIGTLNWRCDGQVSIVSSRETVESGQGAVRGDLENRPVPRTAHVRGAIEVAIRAQSQTAVGIASITTDAAKTVENAQRPSGGNFVHRTGVVCAPARAAI